MLIDDRVLDSLERLSMLEIDADKRESLKRELSEIVSYVENLNELDTSELDSLFSTIWVELPTSRRKGLLGLGWKERKAQFLITQGRGINSFGKG